MSEVSMSKAKIAIEAGVSLATVERVLGHDAGVAPKISQKVLAAVSQARAAEVGGTRTLRAGSNGLIGILLADGGNHYQASIARALQQDARARGFESVTANARNDPNQEQRYTRALAAQGVGGLIIIEPESAVAVPAGIPSVVIGGHADRDATSVSVDEVAAGRMAAEHLTTRGRRHIAFIGPSATPQATDRASGAKAWIDGRNGVHFELLGVMDASSKSGRDLGDLLARRTEDRIPDALICANDVLAAGVMSSTALMARCSVPAELALIGFDDSPFAASAETPLSTIAMPTDEIATAAMDLVMDETLLPRQRRFLPRIVVRESSYSLPA